VKFNEGKIETRVEEGQGNNSLLNKAALQAFSLGGGRSRLSKGGEGGPLKTSEFDCELRKKGTSIAYRKNPLQTKKEKRAIR